jgi:hypothetical protein
MNAGYSALSDADAARDYRMLEAKLRDVEARESILLDKLKQAEADLASRSSSGVFFIRLWLTFGDLWL